MAKLNDVGKKEGGENMTQMFISGRSRPKMAPRLLNELYVHLWNLNVLCHFVTVMCSSRVST